jgi:hypothetical protein
MDSDTKCVPATLQHAIVVCRPRPLLGEMNSKSRALRSNIFCRLPSRDPGSHVSVIENLIKTE